MRRKILPAEATMSTALETAEALESYANAKEEAIHPSAIPVPFQVEQDVGANGQDTGNLYF